MKKHPWLRKRWNIDDARAGLVPARTEIRNIGTHSGFAAFLDEHYCDGDELWKFSNGQDAWRHLCGRMGLAIVRNGKPVAWWQTCLN